MTTNKQKAIVIDIDGVLLDSFIILKEINSQKLTGDLMWDYFHKNCNSPRVQFIQNIYPLLNCLVPSVYIILSTSRSEKCRTGTEERLKAEKFPYDKIYMRGIQDDRPSTEIKKEHIKQIKEDFDIIAFIDDDLGNCLMAKEEGILALRNV